MPDDVTLDSLAPQTPAPAAPQPAVAPPSTPSASPAPAAAPAAPAAPTDPGLSYRALGYDSAEEMRADLAFTRRFRAEAERVQQERLRNDPARQDIERQNQALDALMRQRYGDDAPEAIQQLPEFRQFLNAQRAEGANRDLDGALKEVGLEFGDTEQEQQVRSDWENAVQRILNDEANYKLNKMYFGTPSERREAIRQAVGMEERRINHVLLGRQAATLRDHAARAARLPRAGRATSTLPTAAPQRSTATDPTLRRRENTAHNSRALDDIYGWSH